MPDDQIASTAPIIEDVIAEAQKALAKINEHVEAANRAALLATEAQTSVAAAAS